MKRTLCTMKTKFLTLLLLTSTLTAGAQMYFGTKKEVPDSVFNALAQTPPMGWNSWNKFGTCHAVIAPFAFGVLQVHASQVFGDIDFFAFGQRYRCAFIFLCF